MVTELATTTLKSGEPVAVVVVEAPDREYTDRVLPFLSHKGGIWQWHMEQALQGSLDQLQTRFYLAEFDGEVVGNICTFEARSVGILGHVFTRPEQRRKGICDAIMAELTRDLHRRGVRFMTLGTGFDSAPFHIYARFGFRGVEPGSGMMRSDLDETYLPGLLEPGPATARPLRWDDWPRLNGLILSTEFPRLRNVAYGVAGFTNMESVGLRILRAREEDKQRGAWVLEKHPGEVVGVATAAPNPSWHGHSNWSAGWLLDLFVHPTFAGATGQLLDAAALPAGRITCILEVGQPDVGDALSQRGFQRTAVIPGWLRAVDSTHGDSIDAEVWLR